MPSMDARAIALAIPGFFVLIALELLVLRVQKKRGYYVFADSIASLSCGVGQQVLAVLVVDGVKIGAYTAMWHYARLGTVPSTPWSWLALLFAVDLAYWTYHWASHRVNFFWATHAVHHQSEEYNLTTALRQSWFSSLTSWIFYAPLALVGFSPAMFVAMSTINTLYQFWIHTRTVGTLGPLEWVLNTPSHHRVHHGTDPRYLDKNYAGIFILWDRLFGTFEREHGEPVYGTVKPLSSWNAAFANVEPFERLWAMSRDAKRLRDKLYVWIAPPEWRPADLGGLVTPPEVSRATQEKFSTPVSSGLALYVATWFALVAGAVFALLWAGGALPLVVRASLVGWVLLTLGTWGGLLEGRRWAVGVEAGRLGLTLALVALTTRGTGLMPIGLAATAVVGVLSLVWLRKTAALAPVPSLAR